MRNFRRSERLCPLGPLPHPPIYMVEPHQRDQEENATQHGEPEDGADEVIADKVLGLGLGLEATVGFIAGVHDI